MSLLLIQTFLYYLIFLFYLSVALIHCCIIEQVKLNSSHNFNRSALIEICSVKTATSAVKCSKSVWSLRLWCITLGIIASHASKCSGCVGAGWIFWCLRQKLGSDFVPSRYSSLSMARTSIAPSSVYSLPRPFTLTTKHLFIAFKAFSAGIPRLYI